MAEVVEKGNTIFVFGCSHAGIIAQELFFIGLVGLHL